MNLKNLAQTVDSLVTSGYSEGYRQGDCFERSFGQITVRVYLVDYDEQPLDSPLVSVAMYHQCDDWEITHGKESPIETIERVRDFLKDLTEVESEVQRVRELLSRIEEA